jgi:hypothetical protein
MDKADSFEHTVFEVWGNSVVFLSWEQHEAGSHQD